MSQSDLPCSSTIRFFKVISPLTSEKRIPSMLLYGRPLPSLLQPHVSSIKLSKAIHLGSRSRSALLIPFTCTSQLCPKDRLYWWSLQRKVAKEVLRRWWSYAKDMGITGQLLLFANLLSMRIPGFYGSESMHTFLKALPDQDVLDRQKRFGLAFPFGLPEDSPTFIGDTDTRETFFMLAKPFVDPIFLETFCILFPWHLPHPYDIDCILGAGIPFLFPSRREDAAIIRLLSLQNLPEDNPRWSGEATMAFSRFLDRVLNDVGTL